MSSKALIRLAAALGVLALAVTGLWYAGRPAAPRALGPEGLSGKAARLEIQGPKGRVVLVRSSATWTVESPVAYPADAQALQEVLDGLHKARLSEEVSSDPARHALFGLNESSATRVKVWIEPSGRPVADFLAGKQGADWDSFFLRFPPAPSVFQVEGLSARAYEKEPRDWLDRTLIAVAKPDVERLSIGSGTRRSEFRYSDGVWTSSGRVLSTAAVEALQPVLDALVRLEADQVDLLAAGSKPSAARPEMVIEVGIKGGKTAALRVGRKGDDGLRLVDKAGEARVRFRVSDWRLEPFRKSTPATAAGS